MLPIDRGNIYSYQGSLVKGYEECRDGRIHSDLRVLINWLINIVFLKKQGVMVPVVQVSFRCGGPGGGLLQVWWSRWSRSPAGVGTTCLILVLVAR